ncbi:MAG: hypothetical protein WA047_20470 [Phenylobacterium sp.]|uniref:hypothetical protein n=1 Tax=Phenylobacterium sp. TaxID=1871053 RepID=UPI003BB60E03
MKRPPEPTTADLAKWKRLVRLAADAVAKPEAPAGDLASAAASAKRAIVLGLLSRENACVRLVVAAKAFAEGGQRHRRDNAAPLLALSEAVGAQLTALQNPEPTRPPRKDIFG